ncbi:MAG: GNAT family N-acetyltransferase [Pseudomonadota bacterium]|nr:GNAT family N-acetyltransferase [Pseudomonadota bacterium]
MNPHEAPRSGRNALGQPIGAPIPGWSRREPLPRSLMVGRFCRLEPLAPARDAASLFEAFSLDADGRNWTYLFYGPFASEAAFREWTNWAAGQQDTLFFAIIDGETGKAVGVASYLRLDPASGVVEVGHLNYSPLLQRKRAATEAMYLMMRRAFEEFGYRRYEWKCDALNAPSRAAAERLGFRFEGIFRQAVVSKGRNRDTTWYSIIDSEWPEVKAAFERWLDPTNFDAAGRQRASLSALRPTDKRG